MSGSKLPVVGIVGGIGAGKSAVADELAKLGGGVVSADPFGHDALRQPDIKAQAFRRWGDTIFQPDGEISRRLLGHIVFADAEELRYLESLVFPYIDRRIDEAFEKFRAQGVAKFLVLDAAILFETGWHHRCDKILFVDVPRPIRLERLQSRGWDDAELKRREGNQIALEVKRKRADAVVDNAGARGSLGGSLRKVLREWNWLGR